MRDAKPSRLRPFGFFFRRGQELPRAIAVHIMCAFDIELGSDIVASCRCCLTSEFNDCDGCLEGYKPDVPDCKADGVHQPATCADQLLLRLDSRRGALCASDVSKAAGWKSYRLDTAVPHAQHAAGFLFAPRCSKGVAASKVGGQVAAVSVELVRKAFSIVSIGCSTGL